MTNFTKLNVTYTIKGNMKFRHFSIHLYFLSAIKKRDVSSRPLERAPPPLTVSVSDVSSGRCLVNFHNFQNISAKTESSSPAHVTCHEPSLTAELKTKLGGEKPSNVHSTSSVAETPAADSGSAGLGKSQRLDM